MVGYSIFAIEETKIIMLAKIVAYTLSAISAIGYLANRFYFSGGICKSDNRLDDKTVVITGANTGIGYESALELAHRGARVILARRNLLLAQKATDSIILKTKNKKVEIELIDLANLLFTKELTERLEVFALHPGVVRTQLDLYEKEGLGFMVLIIRMLIYPLWWVFTKNVKEGAQTTIHCAVTDNIVNGAYYIDCKIKTPTRSPESANRL